ncbi:MAG TPA: M4 family metallopeptidase [Candidatus Eisenbacteria bacterium]|nr:M4 family metallopeptidase [Candidatus Eisenbacteria bacterium]
MFCILPPHILRSIAARGTDAQRRRALATLATDQTLRAMRAAMAPGAPPVDVTTPTLEPKRTIYTASNTTGLPGTIVRREGDGPSRDPAVDEAYDGLGATFDFYAQVFRRNSIDNHGLPLNGTVHFGNDYDNAFWNGKQMVFGDGDGELFNRFTISLDVIGHELTHGVTESESHLAYIFQPGALNESLSDVFGSLVKQCARGQTAAQADWLIGAELLTDAVKQRGPSVALRSMKAPGTAFDDPVLGKDPQPDRMSRFVVTYEDSGGVHINSGIPNRAFYLVASALGGHAWEKAGRIWYTALHRVKTGTDFAAFANLTLDAASTLYGAAGAERQAVEDAWRTVEVLPAAVAAPAELAGVGGNGGGTGPRAR